MTAAGLSVLYALVGGAFVRFWVKPTRRNWPEAAFAFLFWPAMVAGLIAAYLVLVLIFGWSYFQGGE